MKTYRVDAIVRRLPWKKMLIAGTSFTVVACALILFAGRAQGRGPVGDISAMLEPQQVRLGDAAILAIHISGEQPGAPTIPPVEGLRFLPIGQNSQYQSINGKVSCIVSYLYQVQAEHAGDFTLPPIKADINGQVKKTAPIGFRVSGPRGAMANPSPLPPPMPHAAKQGRTRGLSQDEENQIAFLRVTPLKYRSYVGELVPVGIKAFFRQGLQATLNSSPLLSGNAFACQQLSQKPTQTEEVLDGVPYAVLTWHTAMSAVKEGEYPVTAELDATLLIPQNRRRGLHTFGRSIFDNDFFDNFFATTKEKNIKLTSRPQKMRVLPLPKKERPIDFTGAVGRFSLSVTASPRNGMVGDPITIKMAVKGEGNFDRVSSPELISTDGWRTYTPAVSFKPADSADYEGEKQFEQAVIPLDASVNCIPPAVFSYFDATAEKYVTLRTPPIKVNITPASHKAKASSPEQPGRLASLSGSSDSSGSIAKNSGLAPIHISMGPVVPSLRPLLNNPWFIGAQGIPLGALFVGLFLGRRNRKFSDDPTLLKRKQVRQKIGKSIKAMDLAIAGHDVPRFFNGCRAAAQERLGEIWSQAPESITLADVKARLPESATGVRHVFENADAVAYSGRSFSQGELREFRDVLVKELRNLEC
ncbi:MAG: BatD family protein [Proteobacteria bacterium]|nr:BatD family protein [Pseudomonadota bacterium]